MNYLDWIGKWSANTPDKKAVVSVDTDTSYTYRQLDEGALKIANFLKNEFQLQKGDRIAVLAEHSPEYLMLFIACQRLGIILVPLNYRATKYELSHCINDVTPSLIIADDVKFEKLTLELKKKLATTLVSVRSFFTTAETKNSSEEITEIEADQPIFIFYTSGTTGKPRGVLYTNRMLFWNSLNTAVQLEITSKDHTINALPPYHTSGWNVLLLPLLHRGARVDFMKRFRARKVLNYLENEPISLFMAVPTMLRIMARNGAFQNFKARKLKYIVVGGEAMSLPLIDAWAEKGILISQGYGLTEAGPGITSLHHHDALWKKGSIGKPNFYVDVKIVNDEDQEVGPNQPGELCIRGNIVTPGYWNDDAHSLKKIQDGWFFTDDIVKRDEDGFIYIVGRKNQVYISGGENIHPSEIERVLYKHNLVQEAAVIGIENDDWGEIGVAFIVLNEDSISAVNILAHLKKYLAPYKIPKDIIYLDSLPKTGIGKINRKKLKELYKAVYHDKRNII